MSYIHFLSKIPAFGLNKERYSVSLNIQSECGKIRTRKAPNTDIFHAVIELWLLYFRVRKYASESH